MSMDLAKIELQIRLNYPFSCAGFVNFPQVPEAFCKPLTDVLLLSILYSFIVYLRYTPMYGLQGVTALRPAYVLTQGDNLIH